MPEIRTRPPPRATSSIRPPLPVPASARMTPEVLIAASSACAAAPALRRTRPRRVDAAAVRDAAVAVDGDPHQAVAGEVDGAAGAAGERDGAAPGDDDPGVLDLVADQRRQPGLADGDAALVGDAGAAAGAAADRQPAVALEAAGVDRVAGGDQPADIDAGGAGEEHAGAVLDDDRAGRADRALDHARPRRQHPVERRRAPARLAEDHLVVAADVEAAPVDHRALGGLPDRRPAGRLDDPGLAADHGAAFWAAGRCGFGQHEREQRCAERRQEPCRPRHSTRGGGYRHARLHVQEIQSGVVSRRIATKSTELFRGRRRAGFNRRFEAFRPAVFRTFTRPRGLMAG